LALDALGEPADAAREREVARQIEAKHESPRPRM